MTEKEKENVDDIVKQISIAKSEGKHSIKVKTFQCGYKKTKRGATIPCDVFMRAGMYAGGEGEKALVDMGYTVSYEKTSKQATVRIKNNIQTVAVKPLTTTNMIVRW